MLTIGSLTVVLTLLASARALLSYQKRTPITAAFKQRRGAASERHAGPCRPNTSWTPALLAASFLPPGGQTLRPALLWMDMRSADQAAQVLATGDVAVEVNSGGKGPVSAEWMVGKALWIKQNEPELYKVRSWSCSDSRHESGSCQQANS